MTVALELTPEQQAHVEAQARAEGLSVADWLRKLVDQRLQTSAPAPDGSLADMIGEIWADMPADVRAKLPEDGASQHDHYIYGWQKRGQ